MQKELKDYLDQNFLKLVTKEEIKNLRDEVKALEDRVLHQYHITAEALRDDIKQVAEGY